MKNDFKSLFEVSEFFPTEQSCIDYLEEKAWGGNVVSPFDATSKVYKCKNNRYKCKNTGKFFSVRTNTIFDNTKVSMKKWFLAIFLVTGRTTSVSSCQLAKDITVTQKTAWKMLKRIRECFGVNEECVLEGTVELDESFVGGKNKNRHWDKKVKQSQGRSFKDKTPVFGMLQRKGLIIAKVVPDTKAKTLRPYIDKYIKEGSTVYTDEWYYGNLHEKYIHRNVNHAAKIYGIGEIHTNSIEGFWSYMKCGIRGTYRNVSRKYLQLYVDEYAFRYNHRNISESKRFTVFLQNSIKKQVRYQELII